MNPTPKSFKVEQLNVRVFASRQDLGVAAAADAAGIIAECIRQRGLARIMVATGNSQLEFMDALVKHREVD